MSSEIKKRSGAWYILPIFLTVIGGVIAYFVIKEDDPKKAKNCLYLGISLTAIGFGISAVMGTVAYDKMGDYLLDDTKMNLSIPANLDSTADVNSKVASLENDET